MYNLRFSDKVYKIVNSIPKGSVMTYGQIAGMLGDVRQARVVGWVLRQTPLQEVDIPWWRVINSRGFISINHGKGGIEKNIQRKLLVNDGIEVGEDMIVDLEKYLLR